MNEDITEIIKEPLNIDTVAAPHHVKPEKSVIAVGTKNLTVWFNERKGIEDINIDIKKDTVTAIIGPSGCGKSTFLRALNFMHDLTPGARVTGELNILGRNINDYNGVEIRKKVGMVFQKPNPFPTMSIYDNVISGLKLNGRYKKDFYDETVESSLVQAGLWSEVKDRLKVSAYNLSGGQQQRLCIARTLAVKPEIILMDEPTSALDPISTGSIENAIHDLKKKFTIIIVTHNMQQAARVSDHTAYFYLGKLIEHSKTSTVFTKPKEKLTEEYITGKFG
ncbi:MAG: phosphate ABC transporter ATP-binding protein [Ignavibacteriae bacterium]|nr:phosphate ABC transporter ATP-binding protein [Ignavibacteriota bacterium]